MDSDKYKVAIGIPVYNGQKYLKGAIDSVLAQSFTDFEVVISDNASTDATGEICMEYVRRDNRVRYVRQEKNIGAPRNFNLVFEQSRGQYFKWASSNDICDPTMLEKCVAILDRNSDVVLCYPRTILINSNGQQMGEYEDNLDLYEEDAVIRFTRLLWNVRLNNAQNGLIRSDGLRQTSLEKTFRGADICLLGELSLLGKFHEIQEFLFYRRIDSEATTFGQSDDYLQKFYNPSSNGRKGFTFTRLNAGIISVVNRSRLPLSQKIRLYAMLIRKLFWDRKKMGTEFKASARDWLRPKNHKE